MLSVSLRFPMSTSLERSVAVSTPTGNQLLLLHILQLIHSFQCRQGYPVHVHCECGGRDPCPEGGSFALHTPVAAVDDWFWGDSEHNWYGFFVSWWVWEKQWVGGGVSYKKCLSMLEGNANIVEFVPLCTDDSIIFLKPFFLCTLPTMPF